jgi:hypothetical protein
VKSRPSTAGSDDELAERSPVEHAPATQSATSENAAKKKFIGDCRDLALSIENWRQIARVLRNGK